MPNQRQPGLIGVTIWMDRELKAAVKAEAERRGETVSEAVRKWARRYVGQRRMERRPNELESGTE